MILTANEQPQQVALRSKIKQTNRSTINNRGGELLWSLAKGTPLGSGRPEYSVQLALLLGPAQINFYHLRPVSQRGSISRGLGVASSVSFNIGTI